MYEQLKKLVPIVNGNRIEFYEPGPDEDTLGKFVIALEGEDARDYLRRIQCAQATGPVISTVAAYHGLTFYPHIGKVPPAMILDWHRAHAGDICNTWPRVVPVEPEDPRKVGWAAVVPAGDGWARKTPIRFTQAEVEQNLLQVQARSVEVMPL